LGALVSDGDSRSLLAWSNRNSLSAISVGATFEGQTANGSGHVMACSTEVPVVVGVTVRSRGNSSGSDVENLITGLSNGGLRFSHSLKFLSRVVPDGGNKLGRVSRVRYGTSVGVSDLFDLDNFLGRSHVRSRAAIGAFDFDNFLDWSRI
jgi:hypothetical protein